MALGISEDLRFPMRNQIHFSRRYHSAVSAMRSAIDLGGRNSRSAKVAWGEQAQLGTVASRILSRLNASERPLRRQRNSFAPAISHGSGMGIGSTGANGRRIVLRTMRPKSA